QVSPCCLDLISTSGTLMTLILLISADLFLVYGLLSYSDSTSILTSISTSPDSYRDSISTSIHSKLIIIFIVINPQVLPMLHHLFESYFKTFVIFVFKLRPAYFGVSGYPRERLTLHIGVGRGPFAPHLAA